MITWPDLMFEPINLWNVPKIGPHVSYDRAPVPKSKGNSGAVNLELKNRLDQINGKQTFKNRD